MQKCAIFLTLKEQIIKTTNLKEKNEIKLQNEKFIKEVFNGEFPEFINSLKEINEIKTFDSELLNEIKNLIIKFSFSQKFFLKFEKVFQSLEWEKNANLK